MAAHSKTTPNITHHLPKGGSTLGESKKWERNCGEREASKGWEGVRTENLLTRKSGWRNTTHTSKHTPNITHHLPKGGSTLGESKKWERKCGEGERKATKGWEGVRTENLLKIWVTQHQHTQKPHLTSQSLAKRWQYPRRVKKSGKESVGRVGVKPVRTENLLTSKFWLRNTTHTSKHTPNITEHLPKGGSTLGESKKVGKKVWGG